MVNWRASRPVIRVRFFLDIGALGCYFVVQRKNNKSLKLKGRRSLPPPLFLGLQLWFNLLSYAAGLIRNGSEEQALSVLGDDFLLPYVGCCR